MTLKFSRTLIASFGLCTVVGFALAQESPARRSGQGRSETTEVRKDVAEVLPPHPQAFYTGPTTLGPLSNGQFTYYGNQAFARSTGPVSAEEMKLSQQTEQMARKLSEAKSDTDRDKIKGDLRDLLEKQFEHRQSRHDKEIEALEAQVKKLKDMVRKRNDNRREIISKRLDQILSDAEGLGW